jgi:hypothetical protein
MKVRTSFPGQEVLVVDAPASILQHYEKFDYDPPFVERVKPSNISDQISADSVPATLWYRKSRTGWEFNHLEDGHCPNPKPTPKVKEHESVWKGEWSKSFVQLVAKDGGVKVEPLLITA